jgi:WD40 repeat protein
LNAIREWANNSALPQILWLTDVAGAGKSTIAKHLTDEWRRERRLGGCFFFNKNHPETTNTRRLCETIAYQVATSHPQLRSAVVFGIKEIGSDPSFSPFIDKLHKMVIGPIKGVNLIFVLDGLDECDKDDRGFMLRNLLPSLSQAPLIKVFITSRPESDLVQYLNIYRSNTDSLHDANLPSNQADVSKFVEDQMKNLVQSSILTQRDAQLLAQRVNCLFILASTACKAIQDCLDPPAMLNILLNSKSNPLSGINNLYETVLQKASELPQVRGNMSSLGKENIVKVLKAILAAVTPINITTIDFILGIKTTSLVVGSLSSVLSVRSDGLVHILHPTFREYLEDKEVSGEFYIDISNAHRMMAIGCLAVMNARLAFNICRFESSFSFNKSIYDLKDRIQKELQYACIYWPDHITSSNSNGNPDREVNTAVGEIFKGAYPLYWMEVMSALGKVPKMVENLQDLKDGPLVSRYFGLSHTLLKYSKFNPIKNIINDIRRFLIAFSRPISESIPHIYISALPFAPVRSSTHQMARITFSNTLLVLIGGLERWPEPPLEWRGHTEPVWSVAFSPNGHLVVSGSDDNTIQLWDAETGQPFGRPLLGHTSEVWSVAFSPDGRRIVSGSDDRTIRLWDAETSQSLGKPLRGHTSSVRSVAFSSNGHHIISGSYDRTIRLWDADTGQQLGEPLHGHLSPVRSVACSPDGHRIVSGSYDRTIRLWNAETGQPIGEPLQGHTSDVSSVAFSPDGHHIVSGSHDRTIQLWDGETGQPLGRPFQGHTSEVRSVSFSPDGHHIVSGSHDRTIRLWDAETGQPVGEPLRGHTSDIWSVSFSADGRRIVSGSDDTTIRLWDAETGHPLGQPLRGHTSWISSVAFSPHGHHIVSGSHDNTICLWDAETGQPLGEPLRGHTSSVRSVAFSPNGHHIISGSYDRTIRLWDAETGQQLGEPLRGHTSWVSSVIFSPDGCRIVSGSDDSTIRLWDAETGQPLGKLLQGHTSSVWTVAFSPDGSYIVSGSADKTIRLWDAETGQSLREPMRGHASDVWSVVVSSDGHHIVSGSDDNTIRLWDAKTGQPVGEPLRGHTSKVWSVAFSPDGRRIVSGSHDRTIRLWDVKTGQPLGQTLRGHTSSVRSVAFSPDGCRIISGSYDNTIRLWNTEKIHTLQSLNTVSLSIHLGHLH